MSNHSLYNKGTYCLKNMISVCYAYNFKDDVTETYTITSSKIKGKFLRVILDTVISFIIKACVDLEKEDTY